TGRLCGHGGFGLPTPPQRLRRAEQDVSHGRRVPCRSALRDGNPRLVQVVRDLPQRITTLMLPLNAANDRLWDYGPTAEPHAVRLLCCQRLPRPLTDSAAARTGRRWRACAPSPPRRASTCRRRSRARKRPFSFCAVAINPAKSSIERESRSSFLSSL